MPFFRVEPGPSGPYQTTPSERPQQVPQAAHAQQPPQLAPAKLPNHPPARPTSHPRRFAPPGAPAASVVSSRPPDRQRPPSPPRPTPPRSCPDRLARDQLLVAAQGGARAGAAAGPAWSSSPSPAAGRRPVLDAVDRWGGGR